MKKILFEIIAASLGRLSLNTARRFVYPFAPALSRGLGVPLTAISLIIAMNQASGILALFIGPVTDRLGFRRMMLISLGVFACGMFVGGLISLYLVVMAALLIAGLAKNVFDPALQAYVGKRVPYTHRGLVVGILEISWAGSTLIGIPVAGLVIQQAGWQASFFLIGSVSLVSLAGLLFLLPSEKQTLRKGPSLPMVAAWKTFIKNPAAISAACFAFFISAANDTLFMVYGVWLESDFGLSLVAIGIGTSVIGVAELLGEGLTAMASDRLGLKRSVLLGGGLVSLCYGLLPFFSRSLSVALSGLFVVFVANEFTFVTTLALSTELLPRYRATMMSTLLAFAGIGRVVGALCGGLVWPAGGISAVGFLAAGFSLAGVAVLSWGLHNWRQTG